MMWRALVLFTALCLLAGVPVVGAAPSLVCRVTGQPMAAIEAAPDSLPKHLACCAVKRSVAADGTTRFALAAPGCCDLRVTP